MWFSTCRIFSPCPVASTCQKRLQVVSPAPFVITLPPPHPCGILSQPHLLDLHTIQPTGFASAVGDADPRAPANWQKFGGRGRRLGGGAGRRGGEAARRRRGGEGEPPGHRCSWPHVSAEQIIFACVASESVHQAARSVHQCNHKESAGAKKNNCATN